VVNSKPFDLPEYETQILLVMDHGGSDGGRHNTQLGCCRLSLTRSPDPVLNPLTTQPCSCKSPPRNDEHNERFFRVAEILTDPNSRVRKPSLQWKKHPLGQTSVCVAERSHATRGTTALDRGEWDRPDTCGNMPALLHSLEKELTAPAPSTARWLVNKRSPMAAQVEINRVWQALFRTGLSSPGGFRHAPVPGISTCSIGWPSISWSTAGPQAPARDHCHERKPIGSRRPCPRLGAIQNRLLTPEPMRFRLDAEVIRDATLSSGAASQGDWRAQHIPPVPQSVLDYNFFRPALGALPQGPNVTAVPPASSASGSMPDPVMTRRCALATVLGGRVNTLQPPPCRLSGQFVGRAALASASAKEGGKDDLHAFSTPTYYASRSAKPAGCRKFSVTCRESRSCFGASCGPGHRLLGYRLEDLPVNATPNDVAA
jgi:hypothetical protein